LVYEPEVFSWAHVRLVSEIDPLTGKWIVV